MLILTRRPSEIIDVTIPAKAAQIELTFVILGVIGNQVRIGIDAPAFVSVNRREVTLRIKAENELNSTPKAEPNGNV